MLPNLPLVFDTIGKRRAMAIQCVHPDNVEEMLDNFRTLVGLGFENIEVEVIHGFGWKDKKHLFRPMMQKVLDWVWDEAHAGPLPFRRLLARAADAQGRDRPRGLVPVPLLDGDLSRRELLVLSVRVRRLGRPGANRRSEAPPRACRERYRDCAFDLNSDQCRNCTSDYYRNPAANEGNDPYRWRTEMARAFMDRVALAARTDAVMMDYLREALIRCRIS